MRGRVDPRAIFLGVSFALIWASAFTSARVIVLYAAPVHALALRFLISGAIGVALARMAGQSWRLTRAQWIAVVVFGICQNTIYLGANFIAMQEIEASLATIIAATMPLLVALIGWAAFGTGVNRLGALGLVTGLVGVTLIMGARFQGGVDVTGSTPVSVPSSPRLRQDRRNGRSACNSPRCFERAERIQVDEVVKVLIHGAPPNSVLSFFMPSRIRVLIVPSGMSRCSAIARYERP